MSDFGFTAQRISPLGAAEAAPAALTSTLVWTFDRGRDRDFDAVVLMSTVTITFEMGVWDVSSQTWLVVETGTLTAGIPRVFPFAFAGALGTRLYVRRTNVTVAATTIYAALKHLDAAGLREFLALALTGQATEATLATRATEATLAALSAKVSGTGTWTPATAAAAADSAVIKASATQVRQIIAVNTHAATTVYFQFYDLAAVPADGTAPRLPSIPIAPRQSIQLDFGLQRLVCANGLCWASSSTINTKTITAITPLQVSADIT